jgi:hypothetical protein
MNVGAVGTILKSDPLRIHKEEIAMSLKDVDYNEVFSRAKESTVYSHAMVYIREVMKNENITERGQFLEIQKIVEEAKKHL